MRGGSIFINYRQVPVAEANRVRDLADRLKRDGLDVDMDAYVHGTPEGQWPRWMSNGIEQGEYVLCICTKTYKDAFVSTEPSGAGFEATCILGIISRRPERATSFLVVQFGQEEAAHIPPALLGASSFVLPASGELDRDPGYVKLLQHISDARTNRGSKPPPRDSPRPEPDDPRDRPKWRGAEARRVVREWLVARFGKAEGAAEALRDYLVLQTNASRLPEERAKAETVAKLELLPSDELPTPLADAVLDAAALTAVGALSRAIQKQRGGDRAALQAVLFRVVSYLGDFDRVRWEHAQTVTAGSNIVVLPFGSRTLAEVVSAGIDGAPVDLVVADLEPVGRSAIDLPPSLLLPLVPSKLKSPDDRPADFVRRVTNDIVLAVCRGSQRSRNVFEEILRTYSPDEKAEHRRRHRREWVEAVLAQDAEDTGRASYVIVADDDVEGAEGLWAVLSELVTDPDTGLTGLRMIRVTGGRAVAPQQAGPEPGTPGRGSAAALATGSLDSRTQKDIALYIARAMNPDDKDR